VGIGETNTGKYVVGTMAITPRMNENGEVVGLNMAYSGVTANPSYGETYLMPRSLAEVVDALGNITGNWKVLATYPQGVGYKVEEVEEYSFDRAPQYEADGYKVLAEPTADSPFVAVEGQRVNHRHTQDAHNGQGRRKEAQEEGGDTQVVLHG
jgi:hypothetical protein